MNYVTNNFRRKTTQQQNQKNPALSKIFNILIISVVIFVGLFVWFVWSSTQSLGTVDDIVYVDVESGDTRDIIGDKLVEAGVIQSSNKYVWYTRISGGGGDVQAGKHSIPLSSSIKELVQILESAPEDSTVWVTIPEGLRADEIANILEISLSGREGSVFSKDRFMEIINSPDKGKFTPDIKETLSSYLADGKSLEGFLYPDTYNFHENVTEEQIITKLITTLWDKVGEMNWRKMEDTGMTLYEILAVASMLERESRTVEEGYSIADIIYRRMEQGFPLGIDATSLYELKDWKAELTYKVLEEDTPYNSRLNTGLPPTPISNPGINTIDAAINPKENEYFYYIHDNNGVIRYAKTNAEHEANVAKYL